MTSPNVRQVRLRWAGEGLVFEGGPDGGPTVTVDSEARRGLSPTHLLLASLAACMAVDVKMILEKSRVPLEALEVEALGRRADSAPRRFLSITLVYHVRGPGEEHRAKLDRAIALSRDKYCSVLHSLDPSIEVDIQVGSA
ncbi:MAG TPA: OsmC family protein [Longimicrobiales bacterium]|nr:OsmC family protein [Longimicrobiales bacterium]